MGGKKIESDEQQKDEPGQPTMILKPLPKEIHESPLAYLEVEGLTGE
jgi:hypothetical protein